ncbi:MAG: HEAT repeat domain-containing protein, partial [Acidobacteriota bacterium]|nr:HEAT repeat domain-containing protein [Acidobacteriota bacterium]
MKNDPVENALAQLDEFAPGTPEGKKIYSKALAGRSNLVAAKAARRIGDAQCADYTGELAAAFERCLDKGSAFDKGCAASLAIARALVSFDYDGGELFLRGMKHIQREPVWGGSVDTAPDLRAACAIGVANSLRPDKLRYLVELLVDAEWIARAGAVRAIAAVGSESACLLLRYKALLGDPEAEVLSECLIGLLEIGGADAISLARSLACSDDPQVAEAAILALGASRRADAVEFLIRRFDEVADKAMKRCIAVALSSSRTEAAI